MTKTLKTDDGAKLGMGTLITALIVVVVGLALVPIVVTSTNASITSLGATSAGGTLASLIPLFFLLIIVAGVITYVVFNDG